MVVVVLALRDGDLLRQGAFLDTDLGELGGGAAVVGFPDVIDTVASDGGRGPVGVGFNRSAA